ncbi:D-xylose 1-dehydrogenase (NADP(+)) 2 [Psilocybe cubensis]|uniref:D-xylose 1-dehydrogenase (NADP(+)) 2 n=2 Tax=Psilocybe cubensis TaxID=181762 RepID=A0ACB8GV89_PSICU|nr:D-xylose 1-dehydrogenase (NADP(+)) 2 [Psilocybe cubensis]KAH9479443.1 D-xylose 1-dehydrogenase (NADP(+)) 2 [Psilocybe cubensis]
MASAIGMVKRVYAAFSPSPVPKSTSPKPLKFGILGAARIAPNALIIPAKTHPEVVVYAVAARSLAKAQAFAKKHGIEKAYEGYQALLDDPEVDVVYNPLPNMLHFEWTMKALAAGKHVLNEKPSADTADETREMFEFAEKKGLILLDAYHYRFHPALHRFKEIVQSGEIGKVKHVDVDMILPQSMFSEGDIRYDYSLGGGALMDLGCYAVNCIRYTASSEPTSVIATTHIPFQPSTPSADYVKNVDRRMEATLALPNDATATLRCDLSAPHKLGFIPDAFPLKLGARVEGELGSVEMFNFVMPTLYHSITVKIKGGRKRVEKVYKPKEGDKGRDWWLTYRFQLEAMVDRVRGRKPDGWVDKEDSIATMHWIEQIYEKSGLGSRPRSSYTLPN